MKTITQHFINGQFAESHGGEIFDLVSPTTGALIGKVTLGDEEDTRKAIHGAKAAFSVYSKSTLAQRAQYLERLAKAVSQRDAEHTMAMVEEYGGTLQFSRASVARLAQSFLQARDLLKEAQFTKTIGSSEVMLVPVGVAGLITPWNASSTFVCSKVASALAAGCTVVVKPSEMSSIQTQVLLECFQDANIPPGLINVVYGRGEVVGAEITRNPEVAKISFTGSTAVGQSIAREAVGTMKRVTLELGGKSPTIILDDADLNRAIPFAIFAGYMNSGQACIAGTRILVPESRLDDVKSQMKAAVSNMKVGNPADEDTAIGPMVNQRQYERVQSYIRKGIEEGAEILVGGEGHPEGLGAGNFVRPTVFVNVKNDMTIAREEIFGPVLSVISYKTEQEAIDIANDTKYGLHAYVCTSNIEHGQRVAAQIEAGRVMINQFYDEPNAPFGGLKQSGIGREFGLYGLESYLEPKAIFGR